MWVFLTSPDTDELPRVVSEGGDVPLMDGSSHLQFFPRGTSLLGIFLPAILGTAPILLLMSQDLLWIEGSEARREALGCSALVTAQPSTENNQH